MGRARGNQRAVLTNDPFGAVLGTTRGRGTKLGTDLANDATPDAQKIEAEQLARFAGNGQLLEVIEVLQNPAVNLKQPMPKRVMDAVADELMQRARERWSPMAQQFCDQIKAVPESGSAFLLGSKRTFAAQLPRTAFQLQPERRSYPPSPVLTPAELLPRLEQWADVRVQEQFTAITSRWLWPSQTQQPGLKLGLGWDWVDHVEARNAIKALLPEHPSDELPDDSFDKLGTMLSDHLDMDPYLRVRCRDGANIRFVSGWQPDSDRPRLIASAVSDGAILIAGSVDMFLDKNGAPKTALPSRKHHTQAYQVESRYHHKLTDFIEECKDREPLPWQKLTARSWPTEI